MAVLFLEDYVVCLLAVLVQERHLSAIIMLHYDQGEVRIETMMATTMGNVTGTTTRHRSAGRRRAPLIDLGGNGGDDPINGHGGKRKDRSGTTRKSRDAATRRDPSSMNQDESSGQSGASNKSSKKTSRTNQDQEDDESPSRSDDYSSGGVATTRSPVRMSSVASRRSQEDGGEEADEIQGDESRTIKKLKLQLKERERTIQELRGLVSQRGRGTTPGSARHARRSMKDCPLDARMHVQNFAQTYFKVVKYLPENYEIYHEKNPICQGVMKGMRGKPANMPECHFYEDKVVPCLSSRWTYQRSYVHNKMHEVVKGECYERL